MDSVFWIKTIKNKSEYFLSVIKLLLFGGCKYVYSVIFCSSILIWFCVCEESETLLFYSWMNIWFLIWQRIERKIYYFCRGQFVEWLLILLFVFSWLWSDFFATRRLFFFCIRQMNFGDCWRIISLWISVR
jgi:hypothetical protein